MDIFEKQQIAESVKTIVKARWFFASTVFISGLIIKFFPAIPLANTWQLTAIIIANYLYNFSYWLYLRRPPERMSNFGLQLVKGLQVPLDVLLISLILYFSGTVDKVVIVCYLVALMGGMSLYQKKGIILNALFCSLLYSGLAVLEYYGFLTPPAGASYFVSLKGKLPYLIQSLIGFNFYIIATTFFACFLSSLFRIREKRLQEKTNEAVQKAAILTFQTQELTGAKKELQAKIDELEKFQALTVGRELKMAELKREIEKLKEKLKKADQ